MHSLLILRQEIGTLFIFISNVLEFRHSNKNLLKTH